MNDTIVTWYRICAASILPSGITSLLDRNHSPRVSPKTTTTNANSNCTLKEALNKVLTSSACPLPIATLKYRWKVACIVVFRKPSMVITPPTTLYNPKSSIPRAFKMTREVYSDTARTNRERPYNATVFFTILPLLLLIYNVRFYKPIIRLSFSLQYAFYTGIIYRFHQSVQSAIQIFQTMNSTFRQSNFIQ